MAAAQGFDRCCDICANTYSTDGPRKPRCLPCGHTLCTECLGQHFIRKVTGSTFLCPFCNQATHVECSGQEDYVTLAERFPVNFMLADVIEQMESLQIQNTRDQLRTDWKSLKSTSQSVEHKLNDERRQLLQGLDLSVAQTAADINNAADKMIEKLMATVRADQELKMTELGALHETARGSINLTDGQTAIEMGSGSLDEQTVRKSVVGNPASDNMELVKVIKTDIYSLISIDVLDVLGSLKIIVASYMKSCITSYNYEDGTQHCMYKTSSKPFGLVTLRDGRVVVVVDDSKILFWTVNDEITVTKSVKTKKQYDMITQLTNSNLAVSVNLSNPGCVDILNLNCDVIQSISNLSPRPSSLTASRSGVVVVCRSDQSVSCVMSHHDWVTSRNTSRLKNAWGITCDRPGFIYVVDIVRHLVVQLGPSGEYLRDVITRQNGLLRPIAVCFHRDKLYITQYNGEIKIFTWTKIN